MSILGTLDRGIKYSLVELNSEIKRKIFKEAYENKLDKSTIDYYVEGKGENTPLCLYYSNISYRWFCTTVDVKEHYTLLKDQLSGKTFKHKNRTILVV